MRVERTDWNGEPSHLCVLHDITELKRLETDLLGRAYYDAATGLLNRKKFLNMLQTAVRTAERYSLDLSVCICDLDQFKEVNDNYGHQAGGPCPRSVRRDLKKGVARIRLCRALRWRRVHYSFTPRRRDERQKLCGQDSEWPGEKSI